MINFVSRDEKSAIRIAKIRRVVVTWTSLVLGIYVIAVAGFVGWTTLWSGKQKQASSDIVDLTTQVSALAENQIIADKVTERSNGIISFLSSRGDASGSANIAIKDGYTVFSWLFVPGSEQRLTVIGSDPAALKVYSDYLTGFYNRVQVEKIVWAPESGWTGTFLLSGRKKV